MRDQLAARERKLQDYSNNPQAYDNLGFLGKLGDAIDQQIIDGRKRSLQKQIDNFRKLLEECERRHA